MFRRENKRVVRSRASADTKRRLREEAEKEIEKELERELELDMAAKRSRQDSARRRRFAQPYDYDDYYDDAPEPIRGVEPIKRKAPLMLRLLAWCGVILFCFVVGYMGTSYVLLLMDKQSMLRPETFGADELSALSADNAEFASDAKLDMQKTMVSIYYPQNETIAEDKVEIIAQTREDNISEIVLKLLERSGLFGKDVYVKHVFRNVDTVYIDFSAPFLQALASCGAKASALFITGVVRTMKDNFQPIEKVRFLVDSKIVTSGAPVDLTATWQLPK
ncbi:hypothetical protein AGMMS50276_23040 [Synergistales bacterium]|nr:hypothetical protein AGMMS50276_23040 [Synergistales bacterium]